MNEQEATQEGIKRIVEKFRAEGTRFRQRVRRCFMNGKPCIYCGQARLEESLQRESVEDDSEAVGTPKDHTVFIVMPFRPNLDTFYDWSLKGYLKSGLNIREDQIKRADEFRNIGYIMCEKICRRVQEADLIVCDLSLDNPNVFYELGISVGLNKPLLVICDKERYGIRSQAFWRSIGIGIKDTPAANQKVVQYPNVGFLSGVDFKIEDRVTRVPLEPLKPQMRIVPLLVPVKSSQSEVDDIEIEFEEALKAALGVAIEQMQSTKSDLAGVDEALASLSADVKQLWEDTTAKPYIFQESLDPYSFDEIASKVDSAFTCIIDLAGERPLSYFWLGYCHARGINVIPIYRPTSEDQGDQGDRHVLAFDIRALWYIDFRQKEVKHLASLLRGVLEELVSRDVPRRERNIFWERLTRESTVHIFTGAVHHDSLGREVVGDWDLRAVSELVRFLSSADESVIPELEEPMYAPETIRQKQASGWSNQSLGAYLAHIRKQLTDKNCLIIASADVNPVTEVALTEAYGVPDLCFNPTERTDVEDRVVIALKGAVQPTGLDSTSGSQKTSPQDEIRPFFSRYDHRLEKDHRGFLAGSNKVLQERYWSQDQAPNQEYFFLLAHLVVMKNPFTDGIQDTILVMLNGVSGPGTFGMAEMLTGGANEYKAPAAEKLLKEINDKWNESDEREGFKGIEAIIKVKIEPTQRGQSLLFSDARVVTSWEKWKPGKGETNLTNGNPRAILLG